MEHGHGTLRLLAYGMLVLYSACVTGLWFYSSTFIAGYVYRYFSHPIIVLLCWSLTTMAYLAWHDRLFFSIFGQLEGDHLRALIVPLAIRPAWLHVSACLGPEMCTTLLILCAAGMALFFYVRSIGALAVSLLWCMPFIAGWFVHYDMHNTPDFIAKGVCIMPRGLYDDPWCCHEQICEFLRTCSSNNSLHYIIFPESAFPFPLHNYQRCINSWYDILRNDEVHLIMGSHRQEQSNLYNSFFILHNRRIIHHYDKNHLMFFTERVPHYLKSFKNLFLNNKIPFIQGKKEQASIDLASLGAWVPYLCSDLFFEPIGQGSQKRVICLINDSWFSLSYIPELMFLYAVCKVLFEHKTIIYVSYTRAVCIMPGATFFKMPVLSD